MNLYQRINEVRKLVGYAHKTKKVASGDGSYLVVTHDQITSLSREHFIAHGIVIVPSFLSGQTVLTGTETARKIPFIRYEAVYRFTVINADEPSERFELDIQAHAIDQGDKAPGKALSYAKKYVVLKLLEIESGEEEEEERAEQHKPKAASATQATRDAFDGLPKDRKNVVLDTVTQVVDALNEGRDFDAYSLCESLTDADEKIGLWSRLSSQQRASIKAVSKGHRHEKAQATVPVQS